MDLKSEQALTDRRTHRVQANLHVVVQPNKLWRRRFIGDVSDLSQGGFGLRSDHPLWGKSPARFFFSPTTCMPFVAVAELVWVCKVDQFDRYHSGWRFKNKTPQ